MKIHCSARLAFKVALAMLLTGLLTGFCIGLTALGSTVPSAQGSPPIAAGSAPPPPAGRFAMDNPVGLTAHHGKSPLQLDERDGAAR